MIDTIQRFFPNLSSGQVEKFSELKGIYEVWNAQINVISRKDMLHFDERHLLHSLSLAFYWKPKDGDRAIDIGTGGGFPGIPLAILYPKVSFTLVDSIGKKMKVVEEVAKALSLNNVTAINDRAENVRGTYQVALSRAVSRLNVLTRYCVNSRMNVDKLYCLKGGDLREEVEEIDIYPSTVYSLSHKIQGEFFETKKVVYVQF